MSYKIYLTAFTDLTVQSNILHFLKRAHIQQVFTA